MRTTRCRSSWLRKPWGARPTATTCQPPRMDHSSTTGSALAHSGALRHGGVAVVRAHRVFERGPRMLGMANDAIHRFAEEHQEHQWKIEQIDENGPSVERGKHVE